VTARACDSHAATTPQRSAFERDVNDVAIAEEANTICPDRAEPPSNVGSTPGTRMSDFCKTLGVLGRMFERYESTWICIGPEFDRWLCKPASTEPGRRKPYDKNT
jgi:hypothetical protein